MLKNACFGLTSFPYDHSIIDMFWSVLMVTKQTDFIRIKNFQVLRDLYVAKIVRFNANLYRISLSGATDARQTYLMLWLYGNKPILSDAYFWH